eukprot:TRINITY_DN16404_c0_g1_i1.p1 TRINITY_DN16404_c0_g1~~TRINITY_DN16404_c0_g1_i1.p1  ORF type:complete len:164 (+),score=27.95 TRINITY_DN16404_c0_g1_i1:43-492(+)
MLEEAFEVLKKEACIRRSQGGFDGRAFWQPVKHFLSGFDIEGRWRPLDISDEDRGEIMNLTEYSINGLGEKNTHEGNHFLIQTIRLTTGPASLTKILQVALNIGQYLAEQATKPWMDLPCYLEETEIENVNKQLPKDFLKRFKEIVVPS